MELLNPTLPYQPLIFSPTSLYTPKFSIKICNTKTPPKFLSIPFCLPFSTTRRNFHVSAHFGRPAGNRRNSLRKKLIDDQQVREKTPTFQNHSYDNGNNSAENFDRVSVKESEFGNGFNVDQSGSLIGGQNKLEKLGDSVMLSKLDKWVDQCSKDTAFWGTGYDPIFTVFHDLEGNVKRVLVNEDEILKRSGNEKREVRDLTEENSKILYANALAREMERGGHAIPRNSTVAKFVVDGARSRFFNRFHGVVHQQEFIPVVSKVGTMVFCGFVAIWAVKKLFSFENKEEQYTELEKEMMRRKIKSRKEREMLEKGRVGVVQESLEPPMVLTERPKLDKQELMKSIFKAKAASKNELLLVDPSTSQTTNAMDFDREIQTIREMANQVRESETRELNKGSEEKQPVNEEPFSEMQIVEELKVVASFPSETQNKDSVDKRDVDVIRVKEKLNETGSDDTGYHSKISAEENKVMQKSGPSSINFSDDRETMVNGDVIHSFDVLDGDSCMSKSRSIRPKPRVIRSVKEAREFLARKGVKHIQEPQFFSVQESTSVLGILDDEESSGKTSQRGAVEEKASEPIISGRISESGPAANACEDITRKEKEFVPAKNDNSKNQQGVHDLQKPDTSLNDDINDSSTERRQSAGTENWIERNFDEVEPIVKKIGEGFRENYKAAKEIASQHPNSSIDIKQLAYSHSDNELEWMKDDGLRDIVFQVRDNELAGRDPFYQMDAEDKLKFFKGLEKKVEKENEKLVQVHEYLHSSIENLDYGADGISLYDPPEKIIPRWKGPPLEKNPQFLNNFLEQQNAIAATNAGTSYPVKKDEDNLIQKSNKSSVDESVGTSLPNYASKKLSCKDLKNSKVVIEGSDGSVRAGKKSGKEYWQHTKKRARGFLESYNAESDPEVKSIMKDIGKDLDRWITEEEIQEAADLMTKLPERNKLMERKINKLKREMELFGPQAVVNKYREYAEEKEEDYLWWLDLPHVLCIELYTIDNGEQKIGFYSLEMAADLDLEPKPCHVIAFEDAGDCKNLCCIIQAHMDMAGTGHAFVVPRPPKDAFREAKANGFGVTVIRKGELQLNVDQMLEEVEEQVAEIGSKIYHDKLMGERSVDINSLMKGVFGVGGQATRSRRRRSKRKLRKPGKK
ncbi:EMBRYO DEFECTIVE 1703-RELATED [Salix koriyanagi]|uniref:EMBRYO DEFECTIVE 1703-RELATED n=1 Tax=Salix koriyanagi TaxID=2511006 RepID=A0A9Q0U487_9ROSI|nr:EMBRYO DEFECTIVE 1703-RELATED [Salix koriyanagi]